MIKEVKNIADYTTYKPLDLSLTKKNTDYYTLLVCIYALFLVTAQTLGHRMIELLGILEPGGIFIFPLVYTVGDMITELYGVDRAKKATYYAVLSQAIYTVLTSIIIYLPYPSNWHENSAYQLVFNYSGVVFISNLTVVAISLIVNARLIRYLKIKFKIAPFALRSLIATTLAEVISTGTIVLIGFGFTSPLDVVWTLFIDMIVFKMIYAFVAMLPANILVNYIKNKEII